MLMLKVIVMVLDVGTKLDPGFDFMEKSGVFMDRLSGRESLYEHLVKRGVGSVVEAADGFFDMPRNVNNMLKQLSTGAIRIDILDDDIRRLQQSLDKTSSKVLIGLIIAGMLVGSSLILRESTIIPIPDLVVLVASLTYIAAIAIGFYALYQVVFGRYIGKK